jgi:nucleoside-diphosphate-sugar epimerase
MLDINIYAIVYLMMLFDNGALHSINHPKEHAMTSTVLILGAKGRFGLACARAFVQAGWRVLGHIRAGSQAPTEPGVDWLAVDLSDTALAHAAQGAAVVVHALSPAYTVAAWRRSALPMLEAAIALAGPLNATLMLPGNVYNFGANMPAVLREDTPQAPTTPMGQIRMAMETRLAASSVRSVVIRAGNFFGAGRGTWFDTVTVKDLRKGRVTYAGPAEVSLAWAYLPDLARTFVEVAARLNDCRPAEVLHFRGHDLNPDDWRAVLTPLAIQRGWLKQDAVLKQATLPWPAIRIGALLIPTWAALLKMRYLWNVNHALVNDKLVTLIGAEPHTPLRPATLAALVDLGFCGHETQRAPDAAALIRFTSCEETSS